MNEKTRYSYSKLEVHKEAALRILDYFEHNKTKIPLWHEAAEKALAASKNPLVNMQEIAAIIATDNSLFAKILSLVNTPFYNRGVTIDKLDTALVRLGLQTTKNLLFQSIALSEIFDSKRFPKLVKNELLHSLHSAYTAKKLAKYYGLDKERFFAFALLHDIGIPASLHILEKLEINISEQDAIQAVFIHHAQIGYKILRSQNVPDDIAEPVLYHSVSDKHKTIPEDTIPLRKALIEISGMFLMHPAYPSEIKKLIQHDAECKQAFLNTNLPVAVIEKLHEWIPEMINIVNQWV